MGTRSLTCIVKNGSYLYAKYSQYDGYPQGIGAALINLLLKDGVVDQLYHRVDNVCSLDYESAKHIDAKHDYQMSAYASIFRLLEDGSATVVDSLYFAGDSLPCEWCYVIDFDRDTFEVFKGYNKKPLEEIDRFFFLQSAEMDGHYPVVLVAQYRLSRLPSASDFREDAHLWYEEDDI